MSESRNPRLLTFQVRGGGWLERALVAFVALCLAVVAFFFITIALVLAAGIALVVGIRWWWMLRKLRAQAAVSAPLEGEYRVIESAPAIEREPRRQG